MNKLIMLAGVSFGILGCGNSGSDSDADLEKLIRSNNLTGDVLKGKVVPKVTDAKAQLGMNLFFSKIIGCR